MINTVAIIPAKMDSKRLQRKNLQKVGNKTLLEYTIDYALRFDCVKDIIVSTEDDEVKKVCKKYGDKIGIYNEPAELLSVDTADLYITVFLDCFGNGSNITHIIGLQPDHPDRTCDLDEVMKYMIEHDYDDLITISPDGTRNGSVRIIKAEHLANGRISRKIGCVFDECTNIHTQEDLDKASQNIKSNKWYENLEKYELKPGEIYAQYGEEGVLNHIFKNIGTESKFCVEFGAMDGKTGSNTRWLLDTQGWTGLMIEGSIKYWSRRGEYDIKKEWITAENINDLFDKYSVPTNLDLLSIDIDGADYWIWKAILEHRKYKPKVVIIEYNPNFDINECKAIKYDPNTEKDGTTYYGASLGAYKKLGENFGYNLLHVMKNPGVKTMVPKISITQQNIRNALYPSNNLRGRNLIFILKEYLPNKFDLDLEKQNIIPWMESFKHPDLKNRKWIEV